MGESIAEGTIVRWIKKVGDAVDRDEPLFEISTDKVDAEIPSPAAGVLMEIAVKEGETVPVNSVVATIGAAGEIRRGSGTSGRRGGSEWQRRPSRPRRLTPPELLGRRFQLRASPSTTNAAPVAPAGTCGTLGTRTDAPEAPESDAGDKHKVVAARAQDRQGTQRRHLAQSRARALAAASPRTTSSPSSTVARRPRRWRRVRPRSPRRVPVTRRRRRSRRPDVGDAQEDRRAHGGQQAHLGACLLRVRSELLARRSDPQGQEGRVRARRRQADLHLVHREGGGRLPAQATRSSTRRSTATTSSIATTSTSALPWPSRTA